MGGIETLDNGPRGGAREIVQLVDRGHGVGGLVRNAGQVTSSPSAAMARAGGLELDRRRVRSSYKPGRCSPR